MIFALIFVVAIVGIAFFFYHNNRKAAIKTKQPITLVRIQPVKVGNIPIQVLAIGTIAPIQSTFISPKQDGYIKAIYFNEGEYVTKGKLLIQLDDAAIKAKIQGDQAQLTLTRDLYQRFVKARNRKLIDAQQLEQAYSNYELAKATLAQDKVTLANTRLTAPFNGTIGAKTVSIGNFVKSGQQLTSLINRKNLLVQYTLPEQNAKQVKLGQTVTVTFNNNDIYHGKVSFIAPNIDSSTGTIAVHARINNTNPHITPGKFVKVTQTLGMKHNVILIPEQSLLASLDGYSVFIVSNNKAQRVNVQPGITHYGETEIKKGLDKNSVIIIKGAHIIKGGENVKVVNQSKTK